MKGVVFIAIFAFVALQLSHAAPAPDEEKKEETPAAPEVTPAAVAEVKHETVNVEVKSETPAASTAAPPEEKKP